MKLGKPPVVEVAIDFHFESAPSESEWAFARAAAFVEQFQAEYPETEVASQAQMAEVQKLKRGTEPVFVGKSIPVAVRAFTTDRSRYVLNAKDLLRIIFVRTEQNDYPGFVSLRAEALGKLAAYVAHFRPAKLTAFALRYVDFLRIPVVDGVAQLRDYFTICGEPKESVFGQTVFFRKAFTTRPPDSQDVLTCDLYNVVREKGAENPVIPFRMEWTVQGFKDVIWDAVALGGRLDEAHDRILRCFRNSFTDRGWALFAPLEGAE